MLPKTRIKRILFIALILVSLWGLIYAAIVIREGKPFKQNQTALYNISQNIKYQHPYDEAYSHSECQIHRRKLESGPRICSNSQYIFFDQKDIEHAKDTITSINNTITEKNGISLEDYETSDMLTGHYSYKLNSQNCYIRYSFFPVDRPGRPYDFRPSLPKESRSGLFVILSCSAHARWNYYPVYTLH